MKRHQSSLCPITHSWKERNSVISSCKGSRFILRPYHLMVFQRNNCQLLTFYIPIQWSGNWEQPFVRGGLGTAINHSLSKSLHHLFRLREVPIFWETKFFRKSQVPMARKCGKRRSAELHPTSFPADTLQSLDENLSRKFGLLEGIKPPVSLH